MHACMHGHHAVPFKPFGSALRRAARGKGRGQASRPSLLLAYCVLCMRTCALCSVQAMGPLNAMHAQHHHASPLPHCHPHAYAAAGAGSSDAGASGALAHGVVSARDISMFATIRRPSWSSRSSSYDPAMLGEWAFEGWG